MVRCDNAKCLLLSCKEAGPPVKTGGILYKTVMPRSAGHQVACRPSRQGYRTSVMPYAWPRTDPAQHSTAQIQGVFSQATAPAFVHIVHQSGEPFGCQHATTFQPSYHPAPYIQSCAFMATPQLLAIDRRLSPHPPGQISRYKLNRSTCFYSRHNLKSETDNSPPVSGTRNPDSI